MTMFQTFLLLILATYISAQKNYTVILQWNYLNFTWPTQWQYEYAIKTKTYIPSNNILIGMKIKGNRFYFTIPRKAEGTPVTLAYMDKDTNQNPNQLLTPFPSWEMNRMKHGCSSLQNVLSMEIDKTGTMWVLDGTRNNNLTKCPPKIVLFDLNKGGIQIHSYTVPQKVSAYKYSFLNDIVVDEQDGGYAYISDNSNADPSILVYSRRQNRSWKFTDPSMFAFLPARNYQIKGITVPNLSNVNGIALSPADKNGEKTLYYCAQTAYEVYALSNAILKNESVLADGLWRNSVRMVVNKTDITGGMVCDNKGNLYYGLFTQYSVGKWSPKTGQSLIATDDEVILWSDTFAFDNEGHLLLTVNFLPSRKISDKAVDAPINSLPYRVLQFDVHANSYLYG